MLRVLTLNLNAGFDVTRRRVVLPGLRDALHGVDADIVFLQEVHGLHLGHARRHPGWPDGSQHDYLAGTRWEHRAYGRNLVFDEGHMGNALLSRFDILDANNHDASIAGHEPRGLLHARLRRDGLPPLHLLCVHMGLRESHRRQQVSRLLGLIAADIPADAPLIVAGDFNDWRRRVHRVLREAGLEDAHAACRGGLARTFPARHPLLAVDRIYCRNIRIVRADVLCRRPWSHLSDHAALVATVELPGLGPADVA